MLRLPRITCLTLRSWRRTAAAALFALQGVLAVSPVLERRHEVQRDAHVEAQGSRHLFAHDEATCTVCAARSLLGDVPPQPAGLLPAATSRCVEIAYSAVVLSVERALDNHSRAPPVLI